MPLDTCGGRWDAVTYAPLTINQSRGCTMRLQFTPNLLVQANKIALIQCVLSSIKGGVNYDLGLLNRLNVNDPNLQGAARAKAQRTDGQGHLDRIVSANNPVYGANNMPAGTPLSQCPPGYPVLDPPGQSYRCGRTLPDHQSAALHDEPMLAELQNRDRYTFETAALCIDGPQAGVWYGSVQWGWLMLDGATTCTAFEVVGMAHPSPRFMNLLARWNAAQTSNGIDHIQVPISAVRFHHDSTSLAEPAVQDAIKLGARAQKKGANPIDRANIDFMMSYLNHPAQRAVP